MTSSNGAESVPGPDDPEDRKIITLATSARARTSAASAACLRDTDGRTYAATNVALAHLRLSAVAVAVAMAVSSGADGVEAVAVSAEQAPAPADLAMINDLASAGAPVWFVDQRGTVRDVIDSGAVDDQGHAPAADSGQS